MEQLKNIGEMTTDEIYQEVFNRHDPNKKVCITDSSFEDSNINVMLEELRNSDPYLKIESIDNNNKEHMWIIIYRFDIIPGKYFSLDEAICAAWLTMQRRKSSFHIAK